MLELALLFLDEHFEDFGSIHVDDWLELLFVGTFFGCLRSLVLIGSESQDNQNEKEDESEPGLSS